MPKFTIITPTFDNGPTLAYAIESVKRQTVGDYEHVIVGDGAVSAAREIALAYAAEEPRASFIDNPKGPRRGELHRDAAIRGSSGEIVTYLGDDDLWFDDHLETIGKLLGDADFAHTMTVAAVADGSFRLYVADLSDDAYRRRMLAGRNFVSPTSAAHTRAAYLRLPCGWSTAAPGAFSDLTCWRQFLELPDARFHGGAVVTALSLPAGDPTREPGEQARLRQLEEWSAVLRDPRGVADLRRRIAELLYEDAAGFQADAFRFEELAERRAQSISECEAARAAESARLEQDVARHAARVAECEAEIARRPAGLRDALRRWLRARLSRDGGFGRLKR